ncbi:hypothetical protein [Aporhodopirellula aestuarii]|uniref:Uncharacterized protein n=1 Tax=Aporhodopirellula aestuarii TaxID=2950107 RepID=A0ABT0UAJ8_9BACT|nr:hypothetical protein [Aporhodopirellula aestuarii]MCM2373906.1 hypothetical protein [Aporhodopirellula aestuarii]
MTVSAVPEVLRSGVVKGDDQIGVDRKANIIRGFVVAEEGRFKSAGRGEFDLAGLQKIVDLGNAQADGVRQRFQHPSLSDDGLGTFTGRAKNFRLDRRDNRNIVRADAHMDKTALEPGPRGGKPIGVYLMDLAESDPGALQTSVAIKTDKLMRENDADGNRQPPLWYPTELQASDWVDRGDAVHGDLLSEDSLDGFLEGSGRRLPSKLVIVFDQYLSQVFPDADREFLETRLNGLRDRILSDRFGADDDQLNPSPDGENEVDKDTQEALAKTNAAIENLGKSFDEKLSKLADVIEGDRKERQELAAGEKRSKEIVALCSVAGVDAASYLSNSALSADAVKDDLFQKMAKAGGRLSATETNDESNGPQGGKSVEQKAYDKLGEEWDAMEETMLAAKYPRDEWIRDTGKDRGIVVGC